MYIQGCIKLTKMTVKTHYYITRFFYNIYIYIIFHNPEINVLPFHKIDSNLLKIVNVSWSANRHIWMIFEGSYDTEDWRNYAESTALNHRNKIHLMKVVPSFIITSYLAGDYFQALRNIIEPAAPMVRQQRSLIITPGPEYSS